MAVAETSVSRNPENPDARHIGQLVGYARVSTTDQRADLQTDALKAAGCARVFVEHASGATMDRPQLAAVLDYLRPGDTLAVWRIDRLGRTLRGLVELIDDLGERGVAFRSLTEAVDTASPMGEMVLTLIASFAQLERRVLVERTRAGLEAARARGAAIGRPVVVTPDKLAAIRALLAGGSTVQAAATAVGVSRASVYRAFEREGLTAR